MSIRKVYGTLSSPGTLRILVSLFEHDLDFDFVPVDIVAGDHNKEPFLMLSPFGEVPAFEDGDLTLFGTESRAAMRYISFEYQKPGMEHVYKDPLIHGIVANWIDVEDHQFDPPASKLIEQLFFNPKKGLIPNKDVVATEEANLAEVLNVYEERLAKFTYLGGNKFTSADLTHLPNLYFLMATPAKYLVQSCGFVSDWCSRIMSRPAWLKVVQMIEDA